VAAAVMTRAVVALHEDADTAEAGRLMLARRDEDIARDLERLLASELGMPRPYRVAVHDGIARLTGPTDTISRRLATLLARDVPGVVAVQLDEE
jgi:hypothetical protein